MIQGAPSEIRKVRAMGVVAVALGVSASTACTQVTEIIELDAGQASGETGSPRAAAPDAASMLDSAARTVEPAADASASDASGGSGSGTGNPSTGMPTSATFLPLDPTGPVLPNPDRGAADYAGQDMVASFDLGAVKSELASTGRRLFFCPVDLAAYVSTSIPATFLATLQTNLDAMRTAGVKCMMIVAYGVFDGSGHDATASQIVAHAAQLAPLLHANADVIPYAKAGFVGAYGQWFGSQSGNTCGWGAPPAYATCPVASVTANKVVIRDAILAAYPPSTQVGFPYPTDIHAWYPTPLASSQAFDGSPQSRVGMEDDCPLTTGGGNQDSGAFLDTNNDGSSQTALESYAQQISHYLAYFGEVSGSCSPQVTDCASARSYFATYHGSAFKMIGNDVAPWQTAWTAGGCWTEVENRLGYRLQLDSVSHQGTASAGETITVKVLLRNVGWSRMFSARPLVAALCLTAAPGTCLTGTSVSDLRTLPEQATASSEVDVPLTIPVGAASGTYEARLSIPDIWPKTAGVRAFAVRFANADGGGAAWNDVAGYLTTGTTVTVGP